MFVKQKTLNSNRIKGLFHIKVLEAGPDSYRDEPVLSKIVLPKLSHDIVNQEPNYNIDFSHLTTDEIRELLNESD
jgi:hypothetical protein